LESFRWKCAILPLGSHVPISSGIGARSARAAAQVSIIVRTAGELISSTIAAASATVLISFASGGASASMQ
jgi:hypothetical protein